LQAEIAQFAVVKAKLKCPKVSKVEMS